MEGFEYRGSSAGLRRRFEELQRLDVRDFPNAAHDLLRTVLECSIKDYFKAEGQPLASGTMLGQSITPHTLWPAPDAPGRYEAACSCGARREGTAAEITAWSRQHDDEPWRNHVTAIMNGGRRIDEDNGNALAEDPR